ncbi:MAG: sodium:solute symporter family protein, partial [Candidatus Methanomethylophilaceae archaeon]
DQALNRGVLIGGIFVFTTLTSAFTVGALANVYFMDTQGMLAIDAAGGNADTIIPLFIAQSMPDLFVIVFTLALLAAAMSTLSSLFHTLGTTAGYDMWGLIVKKRGRHAGSRETKKASQVGTVVMILVSVALSYMMPANIIARATAMFMGLCACALLPVITYALYCKAPYTKAALMSILTGALSWALWTLFVHARESADLGLSMLLFGQGSLLGAPWSVMNPIVIGLPLSAAVLMLAHLWYKRRPMEPVVIPDQSS